MDSKETSNLIPDFESFDMDDQNFRELGYEVIDMIADYFKTIRSRKIISDNDSAEIAQVFDEPLPIQATDAGSIINDWQEKILPNVTHLGSPRYFGFVNGSGNLISVLASALAASVNMNSGGWKAGPAATEIERRSISWIAELIGYHTDCGGLFVGGGTVANFSALLAALRNKANYDIPAEGLQRENKGKFVLYMSAHEGHVSIYKSADMLNLGRNAIRKVPDNEDLTMNTEELEKMIAEDLELGNIPFCVVAQVGSINLGVVDPLEKIADICSRYELWFHADGACGAFGAMLPELKHHYKGLERADSITLDPHKWLYIPYECGCLLVKEPEKLRRTFSMSAPYLQNSLPTDYKGLDYFDYGPQMSRGFNALKVWMSLKFHGKEGYMQLLRQNIACAQHMYDLVKRSDHFVPLHEPLLFIISFRYFPKEMRRQEDLNAPDKNLDRLNQQIADAVMSTGFAFIMTSKIRGNIVIRLSICSHRTTLKDMEDVLEKLEHAAGSIQ